MPDVIDGMLHYQKKAPTWRCEEQIKPTLDMFRQYYPDLCVTQRQRGMCYTAAREIVRIVGEAKAPQVVEQAHYHHKRNGLYVASLWSLVWYAPKLLAKTKQDDGMRYLEALDE